MKIGVIGGTGGQGLGIAVRFAQAGEDVIIGSRTVDKAQAAADKVKAVLGDSVSVRGAENLDAAKEADILVLTVPLPAQKSTLLSIKEAAAGKPLLDATGPLEATIGGSPTKYISLPDGSAAQRSQANLPDAKVICAFNNISEHCLMAVDGEIDCDCLICGNDKEAKAFVTRSSRRSWSQGHRLRRSWAGLYHREDHTALDRTEHPEQEPVWRDQDHRPR